MKNLIFILLLFPTLLIAQVGIGTTNPSASLEIVASDQAAPSNTDGLLIPKIDEFPAVNPGGGQNGMLVFVTGNGTPTQGFYYWDNGNTVWVPIQSIERINDLIDGKSDVDGSNDGSSLFLGISAGENDDSSNNKNIGIGYQSLRDVVGADANDPEGQNNVAIGYQSLRLNTSGRQNIAIGSFTLDANLSGFNNTAVGHNALTANETGLRNTAIGQSTLIANTSGNNNTAVGGQTLSANTTGSSNVAVGAFTLTNNTVGVNNVAMGNQSLRFNIFGDGNLALGDYAGRALDDENTADNNNDRNVYVGANAGNSDVNASNNVYIGYEAGGGDYNPEDNSGTSESKSGNVFIGYQAGYNESNNSRLYIENSNAGQNGALVYGRFDIDLFRINGTLQVGNPTATNDYAFPTTDGTANQVLTTNGAGVVSWENQNSTLSATRATLSTNQTLLVANTWTKVSFDTTDFDINSDFDGTTNVFNVPADGIYRIQPNTNRRSNN